RRLQPCSKSRSERRWLGRTGRSESCASSWTRTWLDSKRMKKELEQLELDVNRRLAALADELQGPELDDEVRQRVKSAVRTEALRLGPMTRSTSRTSLVSARAWIGIAAAALLAIALRAPFLGSSPAPEPSAELTSADAALEEWLAAAADSSATVSMLY